jgi:hypothetical protein
VLEFTKASLRRLAEANKEEMVAMQEELARLYDGTVLQAEK